MVWNLFLALIPWAVSLWIFRGRGASVRHLSWWIGAVIFLAFLPNAPYVLTDIIHLVTLIKQNPAIWTVTFVLLPQYFLFMLIGMQAYVLSLINLGHYFRKQGWDRWVLPAELAIHLLCAIGIYLGRFPRFNSWDILSRPGRLLVYLVQDLTQPQPIAVMLLTFAGIAALYIPLKQISLALAFYWQHVKLKKAAQLSNTRYS